MRILSLIRTTFPALLIAAPFAAGAQQVVSSEFPLGKGEFVFVPDSLRSKVDDVLQGIEPEPKVIYEARDTVYVVAEQIEDPNEKVVVRGDTVNMRLRERNLGRFDRGLFNYLYIPKGSWQFGLTASYGKLSSADIQLLDILTDLDISGSSFSIKPSVAYFFKNNISLGLRLGYTATRGHLGRLAIDFDEDINFAVEDAQYRNTSYTAAITLRQYIGLSRRGRFGVFNDVELAFSSAHGTFVRGYDGRPKETETNSMDARLSFSPGISVFMMENMAFNISFGVMGFYITSAHQKEDGVDLGTRVTSGANFKFNIFNINFGIAVTI